MNAEDEWVGMLGKARAGRSKIGDFSCLPMEEASGEHCDVMKSVSVNVNGNVNDARALNAREVS